MSEQKIEQFWRDADGADVMRVMDGQTVEARFRDFDSEEWGEKILLGYLGCGPLGCNWIDMGGVGWKHCQVYDPPEWYINKPDPGEGWRLLGKFPDEDKLGTDEAWDVKIREWRVTSIDDGIQCEDVWYRRRIANNPTSSDSSRSRHKIPSGWRLLGKDEERLASDAYWSQGCNEWLLIGDDRVEYANELDKWHAIRRVTSTKELTLTEGFIYALPSGDHIRITAKGFEVV
jgi:hypothetical protein